jgi:hypothetical protein
MLGAFAVSLSTAYAVGDMLGLKHSLHRGVRQAKGFYAMYAALIAVAAAVVLVPGSPLGLLTEGVQVLAGVLLPSATVFLLLLCNDREVLGPWVNGRVTNVFASGVVAVLIVLSVILTVSVIFGPVSSGEIIAIMVGCVAAAVATGAFVLIRGWHGKRGADHVDSGGRRVSVAPRLDRAARESWRMPQLTMLAPVQMSAGRRVCMSAMWIYLALAIGLVIFRIIELAIGG